MKKALIVLIKLYQAFSRTAVTANSVFVVNSHCKFHPSCSDYAIESLNRYNLIKAVAKSVYRVLRCNPLAKPRVDLP